MITLQQLKDLEEESIKRNIPIVSSDKGAWLLEFIQKHKPKKILELGTANGYSGIILGSEQGELTTIEINEKIAEEAMQNFALFNINAKIIMGDGVEIIKKIATTNKRIFDLIFIDFHKKGYFQVLDACLHLIKKGGFIIADNITMDGCEDFKAAVLSHPMLKTNIISIRDGLSCSEKIR